jgi:hypothetical protein
MPLPFSGQYVKLAITGGLLRYFEDLPFGCEVWCSVAAIGPLLASFSTNLQLGTVIIKKPFIDALRPINDLPATIGYKEFAFPIKIIKKR